MTFPCTSCGACCRRIGKLKGHDLPVKADDSCGHLEGNLCKIYETRPEVCRVDDLLDKMSAKHDIKRETLYTWTAETCNQFQEEDGLPSSFNVPLL